MFLHRASGVCESVQLMKQEVREDIATESSPSPKRLAGEWGLGSCYPNAYKLVDSR